MFDCAICPHLVRVALLEDYILQGMKPKSKSLKMRRRERLAHLQHSITSDSELDEQLQQAEYIGTQMETVHNVICVEEVVQQSTEECTVPVKKRGRPRKDNIPKSCLERSPPKKKSLIKFSSRK